MNEKYILSIGMSNPIIYGGGTNSTVVQYQKSFNAAGVSYLCITPYLLKGRRLECFSNKWCIILNGKQVGVYDSNGVRKIIESFNTQGYKLLQIHFHHGKFVDFDSLYIILCELSADILFFVHDYYTVCVNFTLRDENGVYCGDGGLKKKKCQQCKYYENALNNSKRYTELWHVNKDRIRFIFPSNVALFTWTSAYPQYRDACRVVGHQNWVGQYKGNKEKRKSLRIAFLGSLEEYKGWDIFQSLLRKFSEDIRYQWYYFGIQKPDIVNLNLVYVDNRTAETNMVNCLRYKEIDVAILWSLCKETYSFTYQEASAANIFIVTNSASGNIADQTRQLKNGIVLQNSKELFELFETDFCKTVNNFKQSNFYGPKELIFNNVLVDEITINSRYEASVIKKPVFYLKNNLLNRCLEFVDKFIEKVQAVKRSIKH